MTLSSILDEVQPTLPPLIWDRPESPKPKLKPAHKHWIVSSIHRVLTDAGYTDVDTWLRLYLTGSLTTTQYSDSSDCDVSLFVSSEHLPDWSRAEMIGVMVGHLDGTKLPGTPYVMQDFIVGKGIAPGDLYKPGLRSGYDILEDRWIAPPDPSRSHDVEAQENGWYTYALMQADKMEHLLRYEKDKAILMWHQLHKKRMVDQTAGKGDFSAANIVMKFLAKRGLMPAIAEASGERIAARLAAPGGIGFGTMYHVSPRMNREAIQAEGLRGYDRPTSPWSYSWPQPSGNYLFDNLNDARNYAGTLHSVQHGRTYQDEEDRYEYPEQPEGFDDWPPEKQDNWYDDEGQPFERQEDPRGYDIHAVQTHGLSMAPDPEFKLAPVGEKNEGWDLGRLHDQYQDEAQGYADGWRPGQHPSPENLHEDVGQAWGTEPRRYLVPGDIHPSRVSLAEHIPSWNISREDGYDDQQDEYPQPWAAVPMTEWPMPGHESKTFKVADLDHQAVLDANAGLDLEGLPGPINVPGTGPLRFHSSAPIQQMAEDYGRRYGIPQRRPADYRGIDPAISARIAQEYERMAHDPNDPAVRASYEALAKETRDQYDHAAQNGYRFEFYPPDRDPYPNSPREAVLDLHHNRHMYVYPTSAGYGSDDQNLDHPLLADSGVRWGGQPVTHNDLFRAVHDLYGHAKEGLGFRAVGEDNAFRQHAGMFSPTALPAMTAETRGQNSFVNYGVNGEHNQTASQGDTIYAPQKAGVMPAWTSDPDLHKPQVQSSIRVSSDYKVNEGTQTSDPNDPNRPLLWLPGHRRVLRGAPGATQRDLVQEFDPLLRHVVDVANQERARGYESVPDAYYHFPDYPHHIQGTMLPNGQAHWYSTSLHSDQGAYDREKSNGWHPDAPAVNAVLGAEEYDRRGDPRACPRCGGDGWGPQPYHDNARGCGVYNEEERQKGGCGGSGMSESNPFEEWEHRSPWLDEWEVQHPTALARGRSINPELASYHPSCPVCNQPPSLLQPMAHGWSTAYQCPQMHKYELNDGRSANLGPIIDRDTGRLVQSSVHEADKPKDPPHYRLATKSPEACLTCKFFHHKKCWRYGNKEVREDHVCDSWSKGDRIGTPGFFSRVASIDQVAQEAYAAAHSRGGITIGLGGVPKTEGFAFCPTKETEVRVPLASLTPEVIEQFIQRNLATLSAPDNYLGLWVDDGVVYIDVSQVLPDERRALAIAAANHQLAIFDLSNLREIRVPEAAPTPVMSAARPGARVLYNKFRPDPAHPGKRVLPWIYDPKDDVVHLGPAGAYHWQLINRTPELRSQFDPETAWSGASTGMGAPGLVHGTMAWPSKESEFLSRDAPHEVKQRINETLGGPPLPEGPEVWDFS